MGLAGVDFVVQELGLHTGQAILAIGCGAGRHPLELARRGYSCTGIDQSAEMLEIARAAVKDRGLHVNFVRGDASTTTLEEDFDHAVCVCEGAFSLPEQGTRPVEYHRCILRNVHGMLKPGESPGGVRHHEGSPRASRCR